MKKEIVFFMPSFEGGGVEKNIRMIANYFATKNVKISLITTSKKVKKKFAKKIKFISPENHIWDKQKRFIKFIICIYFLLKNYRNNKEINVFCFQGNILCILFCKMFGLKIVIRPNSSPSGWSKNYLKNLIFSKILKLSDNIVVNSNDFKRELKSKFNLNSKCIYNPLNIDEISMLSKKKIKFNFYKKNTINLISIGRLVEQKDHITILKSLNYLKKKCNLRLLILGEGDQKENLLNYVNKNNLNNLVKINKRTNNPYPYIRKSHVLLLSSKFEGLPNVLLEGIALNKFIISSNCPTGPREILDNGKGGLLFKIENHKELSEKILFYKKNYKLCLRKKRHARNRSIRFDYYRNLNEYLKLFKKL
ncbi:glycosyltransferase [Candidatus Pelagibacter sp.]|nr:glycosyltransferase [Candidatus Pelagibacter sp.]